LCDCLERLKAENSPFFGSTLVERITDRSFCPNFLNRTKIDLKVVISKRSESTYAVIGGLI
jgi:hypothetical protein